MIFWFSSAASFLVGERERATVGALTTQETPSKLLPPNPISEILFLLKNCLGTTTNPWNICWSRFSAINVHLKTN